MTATHGSWCWWALGRGLHGGICFSLSLYLWYVFVVCSLALASWAYVIMLHCACVQLEARFFFWTAAVIAGVLYYVVDAPAVLNATGEFTVAWRDALPLSLCRPSLTHSNPMPFKTSPVSPNNEQTAAGDFATTASTTTIQMWNK